MGRSSGPRAARRGQALVELAVAMPVVLLLAVGLLQLALYLHAEGVVRGACEEGARVASAGAEDQLDAGVAVANALVGAGLSSSTAVTITASEDRDTVTFEAHGALPLVLPGFWARALPLSARVVTDRERFHAP
ncbi:MAG TPA: TadE/TadG family type IV pilus assembly protein [Thermomicrobiales bacterium]|nr:TadE/TadG family type IV pilus assembly protein [Thermomicrobiales bacterium]